jgi:hypothetical protein
MCWGKPASPSGTGMRRLQREKHNLTNRDCIVRTGTSYEGHFALQRSRRQAEGARDLVVLVAIGFGTSCAGHDGSRFDGDCC